VAPDVFHLHELLRADFSPSAPVIKLERTLTAAPRSKFSTPHGAVVANHAERSANP